MPHIDLDAPRLSLAEAARKLGCHVNTLHRWRQRGIRGRKLRFVRVGWRSYILRSELEDWIGHLSDPPPEADRPDDYRRRADDADRRAESMGI